MKSNDNITNNPFDKYEMPTVVYGEPIYISINEREQLYRADFSAWPQLAAQRDIFVFQCLIGCRVGDLYELKDRNIIAGELQYTPQKTAKEKGEPVKVPLTETAKEILERYNGQDARGRLFPFISVQKYNDNIKKAFAKAGLTRSVVVRNSLTGRDEVRRLDEVASSHMARRTFVGNLYKQVKDPNLIGSMSGHSVGSKAFARYRSIDSETRRQTVELLETKQPSEPQADQLQKLIADLTPQQIKKLINQLKKNEKN